jgi:hypothetical protein
MADRAVQRRHRAAPRGSAGEKRGRGDGGASTSSSKTQRAFVLGESGVEIARAEGRKIDDACEVARVAGTPSLDQVAERAVEARDRLAAVAAVSDELGEHQVESGGRSSPPRSGVEAVPSPVGSRNRRIVPVAGTKPCSGTSAQIRHSIAWPCAETPRAGRAAALPTPAARQIDPVTNR